MTQWRKSHDVSRTERWVFVLALARVARCRYDDKLMECSREYDLEWYSGSLTKIDNVLTSEKISKTMKEIWNTLFQKGFFPDIPNSQGLGVCLRLLFLEDIARSLLRVELPEQSRCFVDAIMKKMTLHYRKSMNALIEGMTTKAWKYIGADWLMEKIGLANKYIDIPPALIPENYARSVEDTEKLLSEMLLAQPLQPNLTTARRLVDVFNACLP